jgi:uncharacterized protein (DUF1499 family)
MSTLAKVLLGLVGFAVFLEILVLLGVFSGKRPDNLGVENGKLAPCPESPNCVSTQADPSDEEHYMAPLSYTTSMEEARARVLDVVRSMSRTRVITEETRYLYVEFSTATLRFVDDVEFFFDEDEKLIHFRSASRLGYSDMGLNRRRMTQIREAFEARE